MNQSMPNFDPTQENEPVFSVSQLSALIRGTLEMAIPEIWVSGEISNLAQPRSGHIYLTLKDDDSQIKAVIWKGTASRLPFDLEDGQQVICRGNIDVYPPRGTYQLVIREVEPQGLGALQLALKKLQQKLEAEGLFDPAVKKPLPAFPRNIAVVTSPTGAAIRDFLEVAGRRWQGANVLVIPVKVQGQGAAKEIATGIQQANQLQPQPDVLVVGRGGGSLEDLWCFNEEIVCRAIFGSNIPVVSAVGHEIDVTLSDLVADRRALTPSEAAELVVPARAEIQKSLDHYRTRLGQSLRMKAASARNIIDRIRDKRVFAKPFEKLQLASQKLDDTEVLLTKSIQQILKEKRQQLVHCSTQLEALSPLSVLSRGYSVTRSKESGRVIHAADEVKPGELLETILQEGKIISRVE